MKHGGAAFPRPIGNNGLPSHDEHHANSQQDGMTLRDFFAAKAMPHWFGTGSPESRAKACYADADAMLAEKEKKESQ